MKYKVIAGSDCGGGTCPTVYAADELGGDVLVQGYVVPAAEAVQLGVPEGETLVRVPRTMLREVPDA
jgi:hypothetical protein